MILPESTFGAQTRALLEVTSFGWIFCTVREITPLTVYESWKRNRERFFETVRRIQEVNENADPDEVMQDILEA